MCCVPISYNPPSPVSLIQIKAWLVSYKACSPFCNPCRISSFFFSQEKARTRFALQYYRAWETMWRKWNENTAHLICMINEMSEKSDTEKTAMRLNCEMSEKKNCNTRMCFFSLLFPFQTDFFAMLFHVFGACSFLFGCEWARECFFSFAILFSSSIQSSIRAFVCWPILKSCCFICEYCHAHAVCVCVNVYAYGNSNNTITTTTSNPKENGILKKKHPRNWRWMLHCDFLRP